MSTELIAEWNKVNHISKKEQTILRTQYNKMLYSKSIFQYLFKRSTLHQFIQQWFSDQTIESVNLSQYYKLLTEIDKLTKLSSHQSKLIKQLLTLDQVNEFLKKEYTTLDQVSFYDYKKLIYNNPTFSFQGLMIKKLPHNPFEVLEYSMNHEFGFQQAKCCGEKMLYIKFYDMLILDIDDLSLNDLIDLFGLFPKLRYRVYKTFKGFHVFITNMPLRYSSDDSIQLARLLHCDLYYLLFCKHNGNIIRLSPKVGRCEAKTHEYLCDIHDQLPMDPHCEELVSLFDAKLKIAERYHRKNWTDDLSDLDPHMFYDEFLINIINPPVIKDPHYKIKQFRDFVFQTKGITYGTITACASGVMPLVKKPQRCYTSKRDYYIAVDMYTNMHYICHRNILMIDIDTKDDHILDKLPFRSHDSYLIQKSANGYHIFVTNRYYDHGSKEAIEYLIDFGSDIHYIMCSFLRGFSVRLNKKTRNEPDQLYTYMKSIRPEGARIEIIEYLTNIKKYIGWFSDEYVNTSR